ncbi:MAG: type II secretion system F family protein [Clostridiales bacterium]|nr:type II secretion system F family protein [Clostridiales bacterium]
MRIIILLIATVLTVLFVIQERRGSEAAYLYENLDVGKFPVPGLYTVGYAWSNKGPLRMNKKTAAYLKSQTAILYEPQYADYYAMVVWTQVISFVHLFLAISFIFAGLIYDLAGFILIAGLVLSFITAGFFLTQLKSVVDERTARCEAKLPEVVSTMAILVNSGMVLKDAWKLVADNGEGDFYELMRRASDDMNNGYSDIDAIFKFGRASNSGEIKKFVSALLQSMEKGGAELTSFLANQSTELWKMKRQHMLQEGEKAATKLLAPIVLIFIGVMIIVITSAFAGGLF